MKPASFKLWRNVVTMCVVLVNDVLRRKPIIGMDCCACAKRPRGHRTTQRTEKFPPPHFPPPALGDVIVTAELIVTKGVKKPFRYRNMKCWPMSVVGQSEASGPRATRCPLLVR